MLSIRKEVKEGLTNPLLFHGLFFLFNETITLIKKGKFNMKKFIFLVAVGIALLATACGEHEERSNSSNNIIVETIEVETIEVEEVIK